MKKIIYSLFLFCLLSNSLIAQWVELNSGITGVRLMSVHFINDTVGFAVGGLVWGNGIILKTTNAGQSWSAYNVNNKLDCVYFPSIDTGYAVGENATIMKTVDGGTSWVYQNSDILTDFEITSVFFTDNNTGYATPVNGPSSIFLKTIDGGLTWQNISNNLISGRAIYFPSKNIGYTISHSFYKTSNEGLNWSSYPVPENSFGSLFFLNDTLGYASGTPGVGDSCNNNASIIKTSNGGLTWHEDIFICTYNFETIFFSCKNIGYVGGWNLIYKTIDGGNSWLFTYDSIVNNTWVHSIYCTDSNTCYAVGNNGRIIKTTNGGGNVGIIETVLNVNDITVFPNPFFYSTTLQSSKPFQNATLIIYDVLGNAIKHIQNLVGTEIKITREGIKSGMYFYKLFDAEGLLGTGKLLIE